MKQKRYKRKLSNYLINKEIQLKIVVTNLIYMLIIVIIALMVLLSPLLHDMFFSNSIDVQYKAAQTFLVLVKRLLPTIVLVFILVFVHQILITHRICGPLVNFVHTFRRISEGDLTRKVVLRDGDYLKEESEKINKMIDSLRHFILNVRSDHEKLISVLEEVIDKVEDLDTKTKVENALKIIKKEAELVRQDLSMFKVEGK